MKDRDIETLYREKISASKDKERGSDELSARQKELITKLQTGLCSLHMNKKRFVNECTGVEERYVKMLRDAYEQLRKANRELHTVQKKLQVLEMEAKMRSVSRRRPSLANSEVLPQTVAVDLLQQADESDAQTKGKGESDAPAPETEVPPPPAPQQVDPREVGPEPESTAMYQLSQEEEQRDLEIQLSRAQGIAVLLKSFQDELLARQGSENGRLDLSAREAAKLFALRRFTKELLQEAADTTKLAGAEPSALAGN